MIYMYLFVLASVSLDLPEHNFLILPSGPAPDGSQDVFGHTSECSIVDWDYPSVVTSPYTLSQIYPH